MKWIGFLGNTKVIPATIRLMKLNNLISKFLLHWSLPLSQIWYLDRFDAYIA